MEYTYESSVGLYGINNKVILKKLSLLFRKIKSKFKIQNYVAKNVLKQVFLTAIIL